jgi:hypothetical protein
MPEADAESSVETDVESDPESGGETDPESGGETDPETDESDPEMVHISLRLERAFLEEIDATWEGGSFDSRSEFLRHAARDAVNHPEFTRGTWKEIAASEHE